MRGLDGGRPKVQDSVDGWNGVGVYVQAGWKCGRGGGKALFEVAHHTLQSERLSECRAVRASMWHSPLVTIRWHGGSKKGVHERRGDLDPGLLITRCIVVVDEHEDAVCDELLGMALKAQVIEIAQHSLTGIVFDEITLKTCKNETRKLIGTTHDFEGYASVHLVHRDGEIVLYPLHLSNAKLS